MSCLSIFVYQCNMNVTEDYHEQLSCPQYRISGYFRVGFIFYIFLSKNEFVNIKILRKYLILNVDFVMPP
jgi:hypothetical protein